MKEDRWNEAGGIAQEAGDLRRRAEQLWQDESFRHVHAPEKELHEANKAKSYIQESAKSESSNRIVPLSPRAVEVLRELAAKSETDYLFSYANGTSLCYQALVKWEKRVCERASVPYRSPHAFRHTFATNQFYKEPHLFGDGFKEMLAAVS